MFHQSLQPLTTSSAGVVHPTANIAQIRDAAEGPQAAQHSKYPLITQALQQTEAALEKALDAAKSDALAAGIPPEVVQRLADESVPEPPAGTSGVGAGDESAGAAHTQDAERSAGHHGVGSVDKAAAATSDNTPGNTATTASGSPPQVAFGTSTAPESPMHATAAAGAAPRQSSGPCTCAKGGPNPVKDEPMTADGGRHAGPAGILRSILTCFAIPAGGVDTKSEHSAPTQDVTEAHDATVPQASATTTPQESHGSGQVHTPPSGSAPNAEQVQRSRRQLLETLEATRQAAERAAQAFKDDIRGRINHDDDVELSPNPNAPVVSTHDLVPEIAAATPVSEGLRSVGGNDGAAEGVVGGGAQRAAPRSRPPPPKPADSVLDEGDAAIPARAAAPGGGGLFSSMVHKVAGVVKRPSAQDIGHISPSASAGVSPRGALQPAGALAHAVGSGVA